MRKWLVRMGGVLVFACSLLVVAAPATADAQARPERADPDGLTLESIKQALPEYFSKHGSGGPVSPEDLPDVFGPGAVLTAGNIFMKVTNFGFCGNSFPALSSDPAGQWPGSSGTEYLSTIRFGVAAVNPVASDLTSKRRVSYNFEWRPETLDPVDKIYRGYDGIINGTRFGNDDGDFYNDPTLGRVEQIDEGFLRSEEHDGDGKVDEDYAALGQQMYSLVMWDNTVQAINSTFNEKHVPLGLECRQRAWAYSIRGFQDFNIMEYEIFNRSGHDLDSLTVGFQVNMDAGPADVSNYFQEDFDLPFYPSGEFNVSVGSSLPDAERRQGRHDPTVPDV